MHNLVNRVQTSFGFFTSCAFALAGIIAFLSLIPFPAPEASPSAAIAVRNVQVVKGRPHYYSTKREEYAQIRFDLDADLSPLFTWNTKQVFVYVTATYPSDSSTSGTAEALSEAVIWDIIIPATNTPYAYENVRNKVLALQQQYFPDQAKKSTKTRRKSIEKTKTKEVAKPGLISLKNQKPKYQITDPSGVLSDRTNATLQVNWNVQPWVGALVWDKGYLGNRIGAWEAGKAGRSEAFNFPPLKSKQTEVVKDTDGPKTPAAGSAAPAVEL